MIALDPSEAAPDQPVHERWVELEGVLVSYRLTWRPRTASWYLDLYDSAGTLVLAGARLPSGWPVTARHRLAGMPPGWFVLIDSQGEDAPATLDELGGRFLFCYVTAAEIAARPALAPAWLAWEVVPS